MDRFIDRQTIEILSIQTSLKSNMDRFIALILQVLMLQVHCLKSNMDRFIARKYKNQTF